MKPPRSALPLPRYVLRKRLKNGWAYFFNVPVWARKVGCPLGNEPLGTTMERPSSAPRRYCCPLSTLGAAVANHPK
jgi:hypothetical protein